MTTYAYTRVSTLEQVNSGLGLFDQEEQIMAYAKMRGLKLDVPIFVDDGVSRTTLISERPSGGKLISLLRKGDSVIIARIDRGFGDAGDALTTLRTWEKKGINVHIVDLYGMAIELSSTMGRMMVGMLALFSEWTVNKIQENTRAALRVKARRLEKTGGLIPYGYQIRSRTVQTSKGPKELKYLIPNEDEQKVVNLIKDLYRRGKSPGKVAQVLNDHRIRPRKAHLWAPQTISKILSRPSEGADSEELPRQSGQP